MLNQKRLNQIFNNASALLSARCASHISATSSSAHLCHPPEAFISVGDCTPTEIKKTDAEKTENEKIEKIEKVMSEEDKE